MLINPPHTPAATRRVGGGYGGKATRPMPYAAMCAVAANKLQQQVRLTLNRNTDLRLNGGEAAQQFLTRWFLCRLGPGYCSVQQPSMVLCVSAD